jgi:hypothetical protein
MTEQADNSGEAATCRASPLRCANETVNLTMPNVVMSIGSVTDRRLAPIATRTGSGAKTAL